MTATTLPLAKAEETPESQRLEQLEEMLRDPDYAGFRAEIREAIHRLRATAVLEA